MKVLAAALAAGLVLALPSVSQAASAQVAGLQVALRAWGFYPGPIDGVPGPATRAAVRAFQERAGLGRDGVAGPRTRRALGPLGRPLLGSRMLRRGAFGADVSSLQFLLMRARVYRFPPDGYFGPATERALRRYQRAHRLAADGIAGPRTLRALRAAARGPRRVAPPGRYTVRVGDTLTTIAQRFGTTPARLAKANGLALDGVLLAGARLRIPRDGVTPGHVRRLIDAWARRQGVDPALARALGWMESGYQPDVTSSAGAWGVMQITPTAWNFVEEVLVRRRIPRTVAGNIRVGVTLLRHLLHRFDGDARLALGAWYQGERAVRTHGLYGETKRFVANVLALRTRV